MKRLLVLALLLAAGIARADGGYPPNIIVAWPVGNEVTTRNDTLFVGTDTTVIAREVAVEASLIDSLNVREVRRAMAVGCILKVAADCEYDSVKFIVRPIVGGVPVSFPNTLTGAELQFQPVATQTASDSTYTICVPLSREVVADWVELQVKNSNVVGVVEWAKSFAILSKYE